MRDGYIYEFITKWWGLKIRAMKVEPTNEVIVWQGPWRWRRRKALEDSMNHAFIAFASIFEKSDDLT